MMGLTKRSPNVFIPERIPDTINDLHASKMWVCNSKHPVYPYYVLEDVMQFQVSGLGAPDWPLAFIIDSPCSQLSINAGF